MPVLVHRLVSPTLPPYLRLGAARPFWILLGLALALQASAQSTLYWDVDGATAGAGGATPGGNWRTSGSGTNWGTAADGTSATNYWVNGSIAVFSAGSDATGSFTVTVNSVTADSILIEEGDITFNSSSITLNGATPSITVASGLTATFASRLSGTDFIKAGDGTLVFQGTSKNYSGTTFVDAGTLRLGASAMIGNSSNVTVAAGATFDLNGFDDSIGSLAGAGNITLGSATLSVDGDGETTEFSGSLSGSGGLAKTGTDTLILSGASTYTGTTSVTTGVLNIRHAQALGSTAAGTTVTNGEQLQLQGDISVGAEALSITGTGVSTTGALLNISGDNTYGGLVTLAGNTQITADAGSLDLAGGITGSSNLTLTGAGDITLSGSISLGSANLLKRDAGMLILAGTNTSTGATTLGAAGAAAVGTVRLDADHGLAAGTLTLYAGTLDLNDHDDTIGALNLGGGAAGTTATVTTGSGTLTLTGNLTYSATNNADGAVISGHLDLGGANRTFNIGNSTAAADDVTLTAVISGTAGINKATGSGTLVLSGANTYTGLTQVTAGVLNLRHSSALGTTDAGTVVTTGDQLQLQNNIAIGAEALSIAGTGVSSTGALRNISGDNSYAGAITLTNTTQITADAGNLTLSGGITAANRTLTLTGAGDFTIHAITTGTGALNLNGTGTTTLAGTSTYTGATNLNAGTLVLGDSHTLSDSTAVVVASGATFDVNSRTETIATLAGAGTVDFAGGALTTAGNGSTTFSGDFTGDGSFTKAGTGTLTLASDLTFAGTFNLAGGTLRLSDIALTLGTLTITANSIIDFAGASSLSVTNFNLAGGVTLTVQNWADASDYFFTQFWTGAVMDTTGATPMNQITFTGFAANDTKWQAYDNQITPVPEASTYGVILLAAAGGWLGWRRRTLGRVFKFTCRAFDRECGRGFRPRLYRQRK